MKLKSQYQKKYIINSKLNTHVTLIKNKQDNFSGQALGLNFQGSNLFFNKFCYKRSDFLTLSLQECRSLINNKKVKGLIQLAQQELIVNEQEG